MKRTLKQSENLINRLYNTIKILKDKLDKIQLTLKEKEVFEVKNNLIHNGICPNCEKLCDNPIDAKKHCKKEEDKIQVCNNCEKSFNIFDEGSSDTPDLCDSCFDKINKEFDKKILSYDVEDVDKACRNIGHSPDWELFDKELETYELDDKKNLLKELEEV